MGELVVGYDGAECSTAALDLTLVVPSPAWGVRSVPADNPKLDGPKLDGRGRVTAAGIL